MRIALILALTLTSAAARAAENRSDYTKIEDDGCRLVAEYEAGATSVCEGLAGIWFEINDGDARVSVTFGIDPDNRPEQRRFESFERFNNINDVIEWRHRDDIADGGRPFAAILRWLISFSDDGGATYKTGQVLVVSRVGGAQAPGCVVGYVDALVNKEANVMARQVADTLAAGFRCGVDEPAYHGKTGRLSGRPMRPTP